MKKEEIEELLRNSYASILKDIENSNTEEFYKNKDNKWSAAQNLAHLTLSAKLFSRALKAPKIALAFRFGLNFNKLKNI